MDDEAQYRLLKQRDELYCEAIRLREKLDIAVETIETAITKQIDGHGINRYLVRQLMKIRGEK